jgi:hypothetical protein
MRKSTMRMVAKARVAAGFAFGGLEEAIEGLDEAIIRHDDFGALGVRRFHGEAGYGEAI